MIEFDEQSAQMTVTCDHCGSDFSVRGESWRECIEKIKSFGWQIRPDALREGNFYHYCTPCQFQV